MHQLGPQKLPLITGQERMGPPVTDEERVGPPTTDQERVGAPDHWPGESWTPDHRPGDSGGPCPDASSLGPRPIHQPLHRSLGPHLLAFRFFSRASRSLSRLIFLQH